MTALDCLGTVDFDGERFDLACRIVEQMRDGLLTVSLTGKGEPLLFPKQITRYLQIIKHRFPLIELQTNGTLVEKNLDDLKLWRANGLTMVCLSITSKSHKSSNRIMGINGDYNYWNTASMLKDIGLNVRLNCTMTMAGTHAVGDCETLILRANNAGIDQVTFREVEMPSKSLNSEVAVWVAKNRPEGAAKRLHHYLTLNGAVELLRLPHGGIVYDFRGQNVAIGNCLTETTDPEDIRQLIWFPEGRLAYSWQYPAARLL
jgi:hypothetical protein